MEKGKEADSYIISKLTLTARCDPSRVGLIWRVVETGGIVALNHRLMAVTPPVSEGTLGNKKFILFACSEG